MTNSIIHPIERCRLCGGTELTTVIDLGHHHLSGIFVDDAVSPVAEQYPLEVVRCSAADGCGLVQLRHSVDPLIMYADYGYRSGTNEMMRANLREIAAKVEQRASLRSGDHVLDIGCNDGTLLEAYSTPDLHLLGVDPSDAGLEAQRKGFEVVRDFFSRTVVAEARPGARFRAITSIAMFYDLEDPVSFARDVASLLTDDGVWVIELSYLPRMLERSSFDTICHEHLEYYSLGPIEWVLAEADLVVDHVELNDVNGGSFRLFIRKRDAAGASTPEVLQLRDAEATLALRTEEPYERFREATERTRDDLVALLREVVDDGKRVYAYGASTKGNTVLQYCGIDAKLVTKAADRNPDKWGKHTPGTRIPIVSEEEARADAPDYFLVLPWHFLEGFLGRERAYLEAGGRFIVPLPHVRVIGGN